MPAKDMDLTVAITGPTGTFGFGLVPLLEADERVGRMVGIARRPFDPAAQGWAKMEYRQGDVRDREALRLAFAGADVVVHLAFMITGSAPRPTIRDINVGGTLNTFRAAADAGARRFVYASSVAAYGFHPDNPVGMTEDWPARPAARLFYAQEKAEIEGLLDDEAAAHPGLALYRLRPPIVLGPNAVGAKDVLPGPLAPLGRLIADRVRRPPVPLPAPVPDVPVQLIHEADVGDAFLRCIVGAGPPGAYNIAGDGVLSGPEVARELGLLPIPFPGRVAHAGARALAAVPAPPFLPPATEWVEALAHPAIMDTTKAREQLGWRPRYTALEALRATVAP
ncbi:MAG TPA: NAD-dependent epimerase/dehydratase family protein [Baekduia sp.]|nr:NAD-dependent epimerase/dehydratase family protein [Baekduia sp.]